VSAGQRAFDAVQRLPGRTVPALVNLHPSQLRVERRDGRYWVTAPDTPALALTRPKDAPRFLIGDRSLTGRIQSVVKRYQSRSAGVTIDPGDRVVDVGAFLGEFAIGAACQEHAGEVTCLEPDPRSYGALVATIDELARGDVIETRRQAAWHTSDERLAMTLAADPSETSVFSPDTGRAIGGIDADTIALKELGPIDFLKVEAEGAEPEVLEGLDERQAAKVAVSVDPERDGEAPIVEVQTQLAELEYEKIARDPEEAVVYARYEEVVDP
jgi:FkbM family methyltransferase